PGPGRSRPAAPGMQARRPPRPRPPGPGARRPRRAGPRGDRPPRGPRTPRPRASPAGPGRRPPLLRRSVGPRGRRGAGGLRRGGRGRLAFRAGLAEGAARRPGAMTPGRGVRVPAIFEAALACDPAGRAALLDELCGDVELRAEVERLLAH